MPIFTAMEKNLGSVEATLCPSEAAGQLWDIVIVGAGPAGSAAAIELAATGKHILLVDKSAFPRNKICGCCLNASAVRSLRKLGAGHLLSDCRAVQLQKLQLASSAGSAAVTLPESFALSRHVLDASLIAQAISRGVHFLPEAEATLLPGQDVDHRVLKLSTAGNLQVQSRIVIVADGLSGRCLDASSGTVAVEESSRIGAGTICSSAPDFYGKGIIYMAWGRDGYVGMVRLEDGCLDIAAAFDRSAVRLDHAPYLVAQRILQAAGFPEIPGLDGLSWKGTGALTRLRAEVAGHRYFVIGDAAGYAEPFTGEGIGWALHSGRLLAPIAEEAAGSWSPVLSARWQRKYSQVIARRQQIALFLCKLLRKDELSGLATNILTAWPMVTAPIVKYINAL